MYSYTIKEYAPLQPISDCKGISLRHFGILKENLKKAKSQLDNLENRKAMEILTAKLDFYRGLRYRLMEDFNAQYSTNAWMKMYEILSSIPKLVSGSKVKSFHICEFPGAFIFALNHYVKTKLGSNVELDWYAESMMPKKKKGSENGNYFDDKYGLMQKNPKRYLMGKDGINGDITKKKNILYFKKKLGTQGVDFVSSDCGLDFSADYNNAENTISHIIFAQAVCALHVLKKGGNYFMKFFTFFEPKTIGLIQILSGYFKKCMIIKPETSRPINSECYLVCMGFKGVPPNALKLFLRVLDNYHKYCSLVELKYLENTKIIEPCKELTEIQIQKLDELIRLYEQYKDDPHSYRNGRMKEEAMNKWISKHGLKRIKEEDKLPSL